MPPSRRNLGPVPVHTRKTRALALTYATEHRAHRAASEAGMDVEDYHILPTAQDGAKDPRFRVVRLTRRRP